LRKTYTPFLIAFIAGCIILIIPVVGEFHLFSALLAAVAGAFWGAWRGASLNKHPVHPTYGIRELAFVTLMILTSGIPLLAGAIVRGCFSTDGLFFWILIPMPSIFLGFSLGRYLKLNQYKRSKSLCILILLLAGLGSLLIELYLFPQVYFFNHVFGYFPGPIYDESISINVSLVFFRYMSFAWALILWLMPSFRSSKYIRLTILFCTISLMLCYIVLSKAGVISPESHIQRNIGATYQTEHFILYYDQRISEEDITYLANLHEFHAQELQDILHISLDTSKPIRSYVYYHEWQKKKLTGAGATSYVPVWNPNPQIHMHYQVAPAILRHELVHVLSREFGLPVLNASPNIALIEGLATALESQRNIVSTRDELVAGLDEIPDLDYMRNLMSATGFYKNHGSVSYSVAGSFTGWMLDNRPIDSVKKAYRTGRINAGNDISFERLVDEWQRYIKTIEVDSTQVALSQRVFSLPGITEISCPFIAGQEQIAVDHAQLFMAEGDTTAAISTLENFVKEYQDFSASAAVFLSRLLLQTDQADQVTELFENKRDSSEHVQVLLADAAFKSGDKITARKRMELIRAGTLSTYIRRNDEAWSTLIEIRYGQQFVPIELVSDELIPFYLQRIVLSDWEHYLLPQPDFELHFLDPQLFVYYLNYTDYLIKKKQLDFSKSWLNTFRQSVKSKAMIRMVEERIRFIQFLDTLNPTL